VTFTPNPNFERDLQKMVEGAAAQLVENLRHTLDSFQAEYSGQDISVVRPALEAAWAATNEGAQIGEPQLTLCAQAISARRRVWIDDRGHVMVEDEGDA
jgi:hypothetical protein